MLATADRAYYDTVTASGGPDAASVTFPAYCPERRFSLSGPEMRTGRRSASRGLTPEIDLTGPPLDPGISRLHAVLIDRPGLGWAVIDPGSENGTLVNGREIATGVPVPLHDGDRINLGAWTVITVSQADSGQTLASHAKTVINPADGRSEPTALLPRMTGWPSPKPASR